MTRRHLLVPIVALGMLLVACSSDDGSVAGDGVETTASPAASGTDAAYVGPGPNEVGTTEFDLDGRRVQSWYPASEAAADEPTVEFDIAGLLSPELQAQIPDDKRPIYEILAHAEADAASDGPYPVVLFSHGFAGFPEQSADLVTHLASWGFVVVAPDHVERSLSGQLGTAAQGVEAQDGP
ncbi:MAG: hypothetical protein KDB24_09890, partial [Microthrixaceae bacterium]|nr:hypothetical protein [Microthrixaceae bacterium]